LSRSDAINSILRDKFKASLFLTCRHLLGYKDITSHTHGAMIEALESLTKRKLCLMPRGTFKSSIASVAYPIWTLMRDPNARVMLDGEVFSNSSKMIVEIKGHLQSEFFVSVFGDWKGPLWTDSEITIAPRTKNLKDPSIAASGIETTRVGRHVDLIVCDDLHSDNNSRTPEACKKVVDHFKMLTPILEPVGLSTIVVVGTRYSAADVYQYILDDLI